MIGACRVVFRGSLSITKDAPKACGYKAVLGDARHLSTSTTSRAPFAVMLVGPTGHGKSTVGNLLLGRKEFDVSAGSSSHTDETVCGDGKLGRLKVRVYDTRGFNDTRSLLPDNDSIAEGANIDVVFFVQRWGRFGGEELRVIELATRMLGDRSSKQMAVVLTHAENAIVQKELLSDGASPALKKAKTLVHSMIGVEAKYASETASADLAALVTALRKESDGVGCAWSERALFDTVEGWAAVMEIAAAAAPAADTTGPAQATTFPGDYKGQCHCGKVQYEVASKPAWTAACHCSICRRTHSAPYAELCGYGNNDVKITKGEEYLSMYNCNGKSQEDRYFCRECGTKVYSKLNHLDCKAVHLQTLTSPNHGADGKIDEDFQMGCHIFYESGTINNFDKLPKFATLPEAFGGDGKELKNDFRETKFQFSFDTAQGQCHCGEVQYEVEGKPAWTAACHCSICRLTHSGPYAELVGVSDDKFKITKGAESLTMYNCHGKSQEDRYHCKKCGTKVYSKLNHLGCTAVHLQTLTIPNHGSDGTIHKDFGMGCHIFYGSGTQSSFDDLPKFNTLPEAFGGDGKTLPNDFHDTR